MTLACKNGVCMTFTRCGKKMRLWRTHWFSAHSILIYKCCFLHLRLLHFFFFFVPWATIRYWFSLPITNTARVWRRLFETDSTVVKRHVVVGYNNVYEWISRRKMTPPFTGQIRPRLYTIPTIDIISKGVVFVVVVASSFKSPSQWDRGRAQTIQYYRVEGWVCYYVYTHSKRYYFIFFFTSKMRFPSAPFVLHVPIFIINMYIHIHVCMCVCVSGMRCGLQGRLQTFWPRTPRMEHAPQQQTPRPHFVRANLTSFRRAAVAWVV